MKIALTLAALVAWVSLSAQTKTIQGTVYDENGIGMVGVAVYDEADLAGGVITDDKGRFAIEVSSTCKELRASFMGYMLEIVPLDKASKIRMKPDTQSIQETVVTGIFTRKKDSFTGSVQTISSEDIKRVSNQNLIQSLKNLDPSLLVLENLEQGSNPNSVANIQMRGASTLDAETTSLKSGYLNSGNTPLIILDGFETTLQKMQDMDMNRIQSITLLKDASAKAIYGSKGANGVIVIETKALTGERSQITYTGSLSIEAPDLTSYTLCNALEKLEVEKREGYYESAFDSGSWIAAQQLFEERYKRALEGESTYWLSKPLRVGVGNKHSIGIELGSKELKALATLSYNNVEGAMKGSDRNILSGDVNLSYRRNRWTFRNIMSIANMKSNDSPYGTFDEYARLNPYYTPYDEDGNLKKILSTGSYSAGGSSWGYSSMITNPMYNATVGTTSTSGYLDFTDNFYAEYQLSDGIKVVGRFGIDTQRNQYEDFKPADHTDYADASSEDDIIRRGCYNMTNGSSTTFSGDLSVQFNHTFADRHDVFATGQYNISQTKYSEVTNYTEGFPNSNMTNITFARQYLKDGTPTGGDGINRNLGVLLTAGYSYDNRYMVDATIKASASSVFGTDNKWGTFWSTGLAWNLHNEAFLSSAGNWLKLLKVRGSVGSSGNQNFATNRSIPVYSYLQSYYHGFTGATLGNMENRDLRWEEKMDYNAGVDFRTERINATLDFYIADTRNLVFSRSLVPSTGFTSVSDNMGLVRNKGVELSMSYELYKRGSSYFSIFGKIALNDNRIMKISDALENYNRLQQEQAELSGSTAPVIQYYNGAPLHAIWAVPSLGINQLDGKEIYLDKDGNMTNVWSASDMVNCGSSDPLFNGNFGFNGEIKGIGVSMVFTTYGGGYKYNTTLVEKVEGANLDNNVDRRIFEGRWYLGGPNSPYNNSYSNDAVTTRPTTRFVQRNNVLNISSVSAYYEFPYSLVSKMHLNRLRLTLYANDLYTFSSIRIERGTSYPYARTFSFSLTTTF